MKRIMALLLALVMVTGILAGCSSKTADNENASGAQSEEKGEEGSEKAPSADGVEVSPAGEYPIVSELTDLEVLIVQLSYKLTDVTTNTFTQELEAKTNVHLNMNVVPSDSYNEKLNLLLASNDYPEAIMSGGFNNADLVKYGSTEGILIPLNDLIDNYCVNIKDRWAENPQFKEQMTAPDGKIYGIPSSEAKVGHGAISYKMWLNTTWLEAVGAKQPETTEEFYQVLKAFHDQDANGNGDASDEIPLTGASGTWAADPYLYLLNAFGYYTPDIIKLKDGVFTSVADQDYMKEGLKYISGLYAEGLLDPASLTQDETQMSALGNNADAVIVGAVTCGHLGMCIGINDVQRSSQYAALPPLEGPNGYRGIPGSTTMNVSGAQFVITDVCKNPAMAIRLADTLCDEEVAVRLNVGIKGTDWDDADEGTLAMDGVTPATRKYLTYTTSGEGAERNDIWENTARLLEPDWKGTFQVVGDIYDPTNYEARLYQETMKLFDYVADVDQIPAFYVDDDMASAISQLKTPLSDYVGTSIVEFITGKKDVDAEWESYVAGLNNLKYNEYIAKMQEAYDYSVGK